MGASLVAEHGLKSSCVVVVAHGLGYFVACEIFGTGGQTCLSPALAGRFSITEPPGKSVLKHFKHSVQYYLTVSTVLFSRPLDLFIL